MQELSTILQKKDWRYLHCKFDRVNPRPLSFISSAFDRYFSKLLSDSRRAAGGANDDGRYGSEELHQIRKTILDSIGSENMGILCRLIPNIRHIVSGNGSQSDVHYYEGNFDSSDAEASKFRLHHLFGLLVKAISQRPVLLFFDDLHWADQTSLELMMALVHQQVNEGSAHVLFVGSYRSNEISHLDPLDTSLRQIKLLSSATLTEIPLNDLSCDEVNVMVSEALSYPRRLTKTLSALIHQKVSDFWF